MPRVRPSIWTKVCMHPVATSNATSQRRTRLSSQRETVRDYALRDPQSKCMYQREARRAWHGGSKRPGLSYALAGSPQPLRSQLNCNLRRTRVGVGVGIRPRRRSRRTGGSRKIACRSWGMPATTLALSARFHSRCVNLPRAEHRSGWPTACKQSSLDRFVRSSFAGRGLLQDATVLVQRGSAERIRTRSS